MKNFSLKFPEIESFLDPLAIWVILVCVQLLGSRQIIGQFSGIAILIFKVLLELVSIILLTRISKKSSLVADVIDITLYIFLFKIIILESFFLNHNLYDLMYLEISELLDLANYTLIIIRLTWAAIPATSKIDWPVLGPYGLTKTAVVRNNNRISGLAIFALVIISVEITAIFNYWVPGWPYILPALFGIFFLLRYNVVVRNASLDAITTLADRAEKIEELKIIIDRAASAIEALSELQEEPSTPEDPSPKKPKLTRIK